MLLLPAYHAYAAQNTLSLQPGRVYVFESSDDRMISYVSVNGGRYEYAVQNAEGAVMDYGMSGGRFPVRGGGLTYISAPEGETVTLSYDPSKVTFTDDQGQALYRVALEAGQSAKLTNNHDEQLRVSVDNSNREDFAVYDLAVRDGWGLVTYFAHEGKLSLQNIPSASSATFTAGEGGLALMVPGIWIDRELSVETGTPPALTFLPLVNGQPLSFTNAGEANYEPVVMLKGGTFEYAYRQNDAAGFPLETNAGNKRDRIRINADSTLIVTPRADGGLLYYPSDWQRDLTVGQASLTDATYTIPPHATLLVTNSDPAYPHSIKIKNELENQNFYFDYAIEEDDDLAYAVEYSAGVMNLPADSVLTLTARNEVLVVELPSAIDFVSAQMGHEPALTYLTAPAGISFIAGNRGDDPITLTPEKSSETGYWDYLLRDEEGEIESFGKVSANAPYELVPDVTTHFTSTVDFDVDFIIPTAWIRRGLYVQAAGHPALFRRVLRYGESVAVLNNDKTYSHELTVAAEEDNPSDYDFSFISVGTRETELLEFGVATAGKVTVKNNVHFKIMPQDGSLISLCYPYEMHEDIFTVGTTTAPLYRITLEPGQSAKFNNRSKTDFYTVFNNSGEDSSAYFLRGKEDTAPIRRDEEPLTGDITIPTEEVITVTAAPGDDLKLWLPQDWANDLLRQEPLGEIKR
jgi:hypothetical protein